MNERWASTFTAASMGSFPTATALFPQEVNQEWVLLFADNTSVCLRLLDSLSLSGHGESSGEPGSVMILNPMFGNSLKKVPVCRTVNIT